MAQEGIEGKAEENVRHRDRTRGGERASNADWESPRGPAARIARSKDGRPHLGAPPEPPFLNGLLRRPAEQDHAARR